MKDKLFCGVGDYSMNVPLKDLLILADAAQKIEEYQQEVVSLKKQVSALRGQYSEALEKIQELRDMI